MRAQPFMDATVSRETAQTIEIIRENFEKRMEKIWK
jgi:hypothetical protein